MVDHEVPKECAECHTPESKLVFRDQLAQIEFIVSGLCQGCQDRAFNQENGGFGSR